MNSSVKLSICEKCSNRIRFVVSFSDELINKLPESWNDTSELCIDCFLEELEKINPTQEINIHDIELLLIRGKTYDFGGNIIDSNYGKNKRILI